MVYVVSGINFKKVAYFVIGCFPISKSNEYDGMNGNKVGVFESGFKFVSNDTIECDLLFCDDLTPALTEQFGDDSEFFQNIVGKSNN